MTSQHLDALASTAGGGPACPDAGPEEPRVPADRGPYPEADRPAPVDADRARALLDSLLWNAPVGMAFFDEHGRYLRVNDALAAINGLTGEDLAGRTLREALPELDPVAEDDLRHVLATGEPVVAREVSGATPARPGEVRHWIVSWYPVRDDAGRVFAAGAVVLDITDRKRAEAQRDALLAAEHAARADAERSADLLARLQRLTAGLAAQRGSAEVADTVVAEGMAAAGAASAVLWLTTEDGTALRMMAAHGLQGATRTRFEAMPLDAPLPGPYVLRTGEPVFLGSKAARDAEWPVLADVETAVEAIAVVPLLPHGSISGVLAFGYGLPREFDALDRRFLTGVADQCAQALERGRLHDAEQRARDRLRFLAEASEALAATLDYQATLQRVARLVASALGELCNLELRRPDGSLQRVALVHLDPAMQELTDRLASTRLTASSQTVEVLRTGRTRVIAEVSDADLRRAVESEEAYALARRMALGPAIVTPLVARGRTLGVLSVVARRGSPPYSPADVGFAEELARRAAVAIDNARLFEARGAVARELQRGLLPPGLPDVPGLELAARYRAAGQGLDVGGDFYDVFPVADGWAVLVGDVVGTGARAAATTAVVRRTARAVARYCEGPDGMLDAVNAALAEEDDEGFCTLLLAYARPGAPVRFDLRNAGHPRPYVVRADGEPVEVAASGTLLGTFPAAPAEPAEVLLHPGETLVLFTDGVLETRSAETGEFFDDERLRAVLRAAAPAGPAALVAAVEDAVLAHAGGEARDDVAVLALRAR